MGRCGCGSRASTQAAWTACAIDGVVDTPDVDPQGPSEADLALTPARIQACLDQHNGVLELTWRALGLKNRFTLLRAIKKHALVVRRRPGHGRLRRSDDC